MADRTLTQFTEPSLNGQAAVSVRIDRSAAGSGLFFITERPNDKGDVVFIPNPHEFLAPVNAWLSSGAVPPPPRKVSETALGRAIEIGTEVLAIDKAVEEARIGFAHEGKTRSDFFTTDLFNALFRRREALRAELLSINNTIKE